MKQNRTLKGKATQCSKFGDKFNGTLCARQEVPDNNCLYFLNVHDSPAAADMILLQLFCEDIWNLKLNLLTNIK